MNDDHIQHYGIKGMKWGVRRPRGKDGLIDRSARGRLSTEAKRAREIKKKAKKHGLSSLTNKELGDLNKRMQLEQQFNALNPKKNPIKSGMKFTGEVISGLDKGVKLYNIANSPAAKAGKDVLRRRK